MKIHIYIESLLFDVQYAVVKRKKILQIFELLEKNSVLYAIADSVRITRGINNNIQNFLEFPSFDLCITQGLIKNVGSAARMAQEYEMTIDSSSKKKCRAIKPPLINKNIQLMKYYVMTMKRY